MQNKTLTIMFVDVQGYTSMTAQQTRDEQQLFVKEIQSFVEKHVKAKFGNLIKTMGDGFLITFESPTNAISCGKAMQQEIQRRNANILNADNFISLRIGISTGEVSVDDSGDVFGDAVNIAARIQKFAEPNEVFISETTYLAMNKAEIKALDLGLQKFKNVLEEVRVFKVLKDEAEMPAFVKQAALDKKVTNWALVGIIFLIMLGIIIIIAMDVIKFASDKKQKSNMIEKVPPGEQAVDEKAIEERIKEKIKNRLGNKQMPITKEELKDLPPEMRKKLMKIRRRRYLEQQEKASGQPSQMRPPSEDAKTFQQKEKQGLPEERELQRPRKTWNELCGDGVCDEAERANPDLCPKDCTGQQN